MTRAQKLLLSAGLALTVLGMIYGFWYAVFDEHPTLERMGVALASAFAEVAKGDMTQAREHLDVYGATRFEYIRDVHTHGHLAALSTVLLLLGLFFNRLVFTARTGLWLAWLLVFGAAALPLGSFLEMFLAGPLPTILAMLGAAALIIGLAAAAAGLLLTADKSPAD